MVKTVKIYFNIICAVLLVLHFNSAAAGEKVKSEPTTPAVIQLESTMLGKVFANSEGHTLYYREKEKNEKVCAKECSDNFLPLPAAALAREFGKWSIVNRADGNRQWTYKNKPLFTFNGDNHPGDVNGKHEQQWQPLVFENPQRPKAVSVRDSLEAPVFVDNNGMTLYVVENPGLGFSRAGVDQPRESICNSECLKTWRPLTASKKDKNIGLWSVVTRSDGSLQWAYDQKAVYTSMLDKKKNDANGHLEQIYAQDGRGFSWRILRSL